MIDRHVAVAGTYGIRGTAQMTSTQPRRALTWNSMPDTEVRPQILAGFAWRSRQRRRHTVPITQARAPGIVTLTVGGRAPGLELLLCMPRDTKHVVLTSLMIGLCSGDGVTTNQVMCASSTTQHQILTIFFILQMSGCQQFSAIRVCSAIASLCRGCK